MVKRCGSLEIREYDTTKIEALPGFHSNQSAIRMHTNPELSAFHFPPSSIPLRYLAIRASTWVINALFTEE